MKRWRSARRAGIFGVAALVAGLLGHGAAGASAQSSACSVTGMTLSVLVGVGESVTIGRSETSFDVSGEGITDPTCGGATVNNIDAVEVTGAAGDESLTVDLSDGQFAPGATGEGSGASEIEFAIDLGDGTDSLVLQGAVRRDNLRFGVDGANLNGDLDADLTLTGVEGVTVNAGGGNDLVRGDGGKGTGQPFPLPLTLNGGDGADDLTGGAGADVEDGGPGNDTFKESGRIEGADLLIGGLGIDRVVYSARKTPLEVILDGLANDGAAGELDNVMPDVEWVVGGKKADLVDAGMVVDAENNFLGGNGADTLLGRGGNDILRADDGAAGDSVDGGDGGDMCFVDPGDTTVNCEG